MDQFLRDNRESILAASKAAVISKITESMKWSLPDEVQKVVADFLKTEIAPEVKIILDGEKGAIIAAVKKVAVELSDAMAKQMLKTALENLNGYRGQEVFKALLGVR